VALNLKELGLQTGDVVGLVATNSTYTIPIMIGCFLLKCPVATLDPQIVLREVDYVFKHVKPKIIFSDHNVVAEMKNILNEFKIEAKIVSLLQDRDDCLTIGSFIAENYNEKNFM
jgi:acyl-CoA synthetase (AMP-forming)/AMP-acid ligase II